MTVSRFTQFAFLLLPLAASCGSTEEMNPPPGDGQDVTAPTFIGAEQAAAGDPVSAPGTIDLSWKAASDDKSAADKISYLVYQATAQKGEDFAAPTYTTQSGATSYNVSGLQSGTQYFFVVRARDEAGNIDTNSNEVSATTTASADKKPPMFAGLVSAAASGSSHIMLTWNAATDDVTKAAKITYLIYQAAAAGGEKYSQPASYTATGVTTYDVTNLKAGTDYYFVVRAQDEAMNVEMNTVEKTAKTGSVSFKTDIQPILSASCGGCHGAMKPASGLDLSSAAASYAGMVGVASSACTSDQRVVAAQPDKSYLISKLNGAAPMGGCYKGAQMPKGAAALPAEQISLIRDWIAGGAANN